MNNELAVKIAREIDEHTSVTLIRDAGDPEEIANIAAIVVSHLPAWRPIAEAPKDGTRILIRLEGDDNCLITAAFWSSHCDKWYGVSPSAAGTFMDRHKATHFLPLDALPPIPKETS